MTFDNRDITKVNPIELKSMVHRELDKTMKQIRETELKKSNDKSQNKSQDKALLDKKLNLSQGSQYQSFNESNKLNGLSVLGKKERAVESIIHFLKTGAIPWWIPSNDEMVKLMDEQTVVRLIQEKAAFFYSFIKERIKQ